MLKHSDIVGAWFEWLFCCFGHEAETSQSRPVQIVSGIIVYYRIINGSIKRGEKVKFVSTGQEYEADEIGILKLGLEARSEVATGDVGYIITGIKNAKEVKVGDTITTAVNPTQEMIKGFQEVKPMVFAGIFPVETDAFEELRDCMDKLQLNDASLS